MEIDVNADIGEGFKNDDNLFSYISSCNIACGGHAGDKKSINKSIQLAIKNQVKIGAHPSFPDKLNFGRKFMTISENDLKASLTMQINSIINLANKYNKKIHHVKPHGALYNIAFHDKKISEIIIKSVKNLSYEVCLFAQFKSQLSNLALNSGIKVFNEVFIDREYNDDLTLIQRENKSAISTDLNKINKKVLNIVKKNQLLSLNNIKMDVQAQTYCIHGDNPKALNIMKSLKSFLKSKNIGIK